MALTITLWVLAWVIFGASTAEVGDLYNWPKTFAFGLFGLVSGGMLLTLWQRQPMANVDSRHYWRITRVRGVGLDGRFGASIPGERKSS